MTREPGDLPDAAVFRAAGVRRTERDLPEGRHWSPRVSQASGSSSEPEVAPMRHALIVSLSLAALSCAAQARAAETPPATPTPAPDVAGPAAANAPSDVVVVANRSAEPLDTVGQSATVLTLPQIRADQEPVVSDILARTPGVAVVRNGGPGGFTSLFIRGAESDQTAVLIDGVKLNDPSSPGGGFNFADLLVGDITRLEVLRGPQSTLYGSQAIGGVVNIVTADPTRPLQGDAQIEGGSYSTGYAKAGVGGTDGPWTWRLAANAYSTGGISAFDKALGGKENDGYRNQGLAGRLGYAFTPDASLDLRGLYIQSHVKLDGFSTPTFSFGDDAETGVTRESIGYAGLNFGLMDDQLKNRLAVQYTLVQRDQYDPTQFPPKTFDGRGTNARAEYQGTYAIAPGWQGVFGAESERESITTSSPAFDFPPGKPPIKADDTTNSGYGQLRIEAAPGLNLTGGVRYDDHSTFGGHATGQASLAWTLNGGATVVRASWGQGFKAPTVFQLVSDFGNTALRPERANGWDLGVEQKAWGNRLDLRATYFGRDSTDLIDFVSCFSTTQPNCANGRFGFYDNVHKARAQGVELAAALRPTPGVELSANYTHLDDRNRTPGANFGKDLARRPRDAANAQASYRWPFRLTTAVAVRYAGTSFDDAGNFTRLKAYSVVDLRASYPLAPGLELYGRVENLFDKVYETTFQFGSPGRAGYLGLRASF
jgi:vitamin B12 transporter